MRREVRRGLAAVGLSLLMGGLVPAAPAAADALYPGDAGGTWAYGTVCETQPWTRSYNLWYIINDATDYVFDIPDPDLVPGQTVTVDLAPVVVGPGLRGHLALSGAASVTGTIPSSPPVPAGTMWQGILGDAEIGLAWTPDPQFMAVGVDVPLPEGWGQYLGALGFAATITTAGATTQTVMLAQPITNCAEPSPSPSPARTAVPAPKDEPTVPPTDVSAGPVHPATPPWPIVVLSMALAVLLLLPRAWRRLRA